MLPAYNLSYLSLISCIYYLYRWVIKMKWIDCLTTWLLIFHFIILWFIYTWCRWGGILINSYAWDENGLSSCSRFKLIAHEQFTIVVYDGYLLTSLQKRWYFMKNSIAIKGDVGVHVNETANRNWKTTKYN